MKKLNTTTYWVLLSLLAVSMIAAGGGKLAGIAELHDSFKTMQLPSWFGYLIGFVEVSAGIALFITKFRSMAALSLIPIMFGATYYHIAYNVPSAIPAILFAILACYYFVKANKSQKWSLSLIKSKVS